MEPECSRRYNETINLIRRPRKYHISPNRHRSHAAQGPSEHAPIQLAAGKGAEAQVEIHPEFRAGLKELDGFSHVILLYHFHRNESYKLQVKPFMDDKERGFFATRATEAAQWDRIVRGGAGADRGWDSPCPKCGHPVRNTVTGHQALYAGVRSWHNDSYRLAGTGPQNCWRPPVRRPVCG